jgi:tetratricopeptide (TPR) repeat protein
MALNAESIYRVLKHGTVADRQNLVRNMPPSSLLDVAIGLLDSDQPGMVVVALSGPIIGYCNGGEPAIGAELAKATHRYAVELFEGTAVHGLLLTTLSGLAHNYVQASNLLGRSEDAVAFADQYIPFYERLGDDANLPSLKLARVEALMNLNRLDEAAEALEDPAIPGNPAADIELARLQERMRKLRAPITDDRSRAAAPPGPVGDDFVARAQAALKHVTSGLPDEERLKGLIDQLADAPRIDPNDPASFAQLETLLKQGEEFMRRGGGGESQLTIRGRIREASGLFVLQKQPAPEAIRKSLTELEQSLAWAEANGIVELQNDALYGIYLCHSRLQDPSAAADALLRLRGNLERARAAITDVTRRGGAFALYPYLFPALCEKLHAAGRVHEMLDAIEASKGRGVADLLTQRSGEAVADASIYGAVARISELCVEHDFHYVTYFVDDEKAYAVVVTSDGEVHAPSPVPLSRASIRQATSPVTPEAAEQLSPLIGWLEGLLEDGTISSGEHLCIAPDDDLANVPFACLPLKGRPLAETLTTSRIHNAFHLCHLLETEAPPPQVYLGVVVPAVGNVAGPSWPAMEANLRKPIARLAQGRSGEILEGKTATLDALERHDLKRRVVHFSTHGMFPRKSPDKAPFDHSGLLLAYGGALPDTKAVNIDAVLTPRAVLDRALDLSGSHVSMMACVSGLSREGVGGDALGMEWAMIQAGAASVLSTHWDVSAPLAATFLDAFYEQWLDKKRSRAEALRTTIASLRAAGGRAATPSSWAAFSLTGDWR